MATEFAVIQTLTTPDNFSEEHYLLGNPDVRAAYEAGKIRSPRGHFDRHGHKRPRYMRFPEKIAALREAKFRRLQPLLRHDMEHKILAGKYDFLSDELRELARIKPTANVSSHAYDKPVVDAINAVPEGGLALDCGAGMRNIYFENVVNYEIVDYDTTDILGVGEALPFVDGAFDLVISIAVLEHVRNPFKCAAEIVRVLKPGGTLQCLVPFLQPEHGYPHHYYNMAPQGLRALFEDSLEIEEQFMTDFIGPIHALVWILASWAKGLEGQTKEDFLDMRVRDFMVGAKALHKAPFVLELPEQKRFELACATQIRARKPIVTG